MVNLALQEAAAIYVCVRMLVHEENGAKARQREERARARTVTLAENNKQQANNVRHTDAC